MSDKITLVSEVTEKCLLPETEKNEAKSGENELESENSSRHSVKIVETNNANLKKDLSKSKNALETLLSEGEASSGFETVSSVDSNIDPDDFDLSSTADEDDFNVVVEIENELAFQTHKGSNERTFYWRDTRNTTDGYDSRPMDFSDEYNKKKHDDFRIINKSKSSSKKYWHNSVKDKNYEYDVYRDTEDRRDKKCSEREAFVCRRPHGLHDHNWDNRSNRRYFRGRSNLDSRQRHSRSTDFDSRPRRSRSSDCDSRTGCSRSSDRDSRTRYSRSSDRDSRTRYSRSSDYDNRGRGSEGSSDRDYTPKNNKRSERHRSRVFRSSERNIRGTGFKDRKTGARRSRSFGRNTPTGLDRDSPPRKRRRSSYSKSPTSSVRKQLEGRKSSRLNSDKKSRNSPRKKERTPFLVELERKLKEADRLKESKKENLNLSLVQPEVSLNDKAVPEVLPGITQNPVPPPNLLVPEMQPRAVLSQISPPKPRMPKMSPGMEQSQVTPFRPTFTRPPPCIPRLGIPFQFTFPEMSVDNLPLVVGPSGLPIHITLTGEQIPHDMDGRRIPLGPNGYYLPLDPTGRLFPHIVSPGNQAVPIHMTEDGVLRLPNLEPVPYGPPHKLPVDIDGIVIPIGPDSRPLFPCPNLPRQPPLNILKMIGNEPIPPPIVPQVTPETGSQEIVPSECQRVNTELPPLPKVAHGTPQIPEMGSLEIPLPEEVPQAESTKPPLPPTVDHVTPQLLKTGNREIVPPAEVLQADSSNKDDMGPPEIDSALVDIIQDPSQKINKADLLKKYKKKAQERSEEILKCKEIEKNLGVNPSKGGVKRSTPMKFSQKKISRKSPGKEYSNTTVTDMVLESDDSDSTLELKSAEKLKKGSVEEILLSSDEEQDILKAICDTETSKTPPANAGAKPKDAIAKKVQQAIKSLCKRNYKPPVVGRFIISCLVDPVVRVSSNESPLLRNRIVLPFITPSATNSEAKDQSPREEKTDITFKFLPQEAAKKGKKSPGASKYGKTQEKNSNAVKFPVFTFDFAMQCDFTSVIIKNLNSKIAELEMEVIKLKNQNANLIDSYKNVQAKNEKKSAELRKAHLDILERNCEIKVLKSSLQKK